MNFLEHNREKKYLSIDHSLFKFKDNKINIRSKVSCIDILPVLAPLQIPL